MEIIDGKIIEYDENTREVVICAKYDNVDRLTLRRYGAVQIGMPDGRTISPEQRKKAHALINEIAEWAGDMPEFMKKIMKMEFIATRLTALEKHIFSLSDCDMTTAKEFITFLIDFIVEHGVPCKIDIRTQCEDIRRYVYACLIHKRCAVCGGKAELHHVDAIGMGRDRDTVFQIGMRVLPLCRLHHDESHKKGQSQFLVDEHLEPMELTAEIGKVYKLTKKNLERANEL